MRCFHDDIDSGDVIDVGVNDLTFRLALSKVHVGRRCELRAINGEVLGQGVRSGPSCGVRMRLGQPEKDVEVRDYIRSED